MKGLGAENGADFRELVKKYAKKYVDGQMVTIVPVTTDGKIIINRQYRKSSSEWGYELPGGKIEGKEKPEEAAARELEEETGFRAGKLTILFTAYLISGINSKKSYFYLAEDLHEGIPKREPGELIETIKVSKNSLMDMIKSGEIADCKSLACMLYYFSVAKSKN
ncbi:MAG: NUDIX hydrolase [Candidatus Micrarchaeaceae archaeon]